MKIKDLIEKLQKFDGEKEVYSHGISSCGIEPLNNVFEFNSAVNIGVGFRGPEKDDVVISPFEAEIAFKQYLFQKYLEQDQKNILKVNYLEMLSDNEDFT